MTRGTDPLAPSAHARHSQDWWAERAQDQRLDMWLRVVAVAYSEHANNGHAAFRRGVLADRLADGGLPPIRQWLSEWIAKAVDLGFLASGSTTMCLVVPAHAIDKGRMGEPKASCRVHSRRAHRKSSAKRKASGDHTGNPDALAKASRSDPDALEQASGDHMGNPDALRSGPISSNPNHREPADGCELDPFLARSAGRNHPQTGRASA